MVGKRASPILSLSDLNLSVIDSVYDRSGRFYADFLALKVWTGGTAVSAVIICFLFVAASPAHI